LQKEEAKIQNLREKGFQMFVEDVNNGTYPEEKHQIKMDSKEFEAFQNKIK
jgi:ketopantoate hydroxymethyltransferase